MAAMKNVWPPREVFRLLKGRVMRGILHSWQGSPLYSRQAGPTVFFGFGPPLVTTIGSANWNLTDFGGAMESPAVGPRGMLARARRAVSRFYGDPAEDLTRSPARRMIYPTYIPARGNPAVKRIFSILLPTQADNTIRGSRLPLSFLVLVAGIGVVRSGIHILSPDGGAGTIAGMNLATGGAAEIILAFALWGSEQLVYALIQWIVILRYRSLVPLMWGLQLLETLGRMVVGRIKPVTFAHTPPGAYQNYIYLALAVSMLALSLWSGMKATGAGQARSSNDQPDESKAASEAK